MLILPDGDYTEEENDEKLWMQSIVNNPAFEFINDPEEDIYSLKDREPFNGFAALKARPALCLTSEKGTYQHVIIAFISSKIPQDLIDSDLIIHNNSDDWESTGLTVDSVVWLHKIVTIPKSLIKRKLGVINKKVKLEII